MPAMHTSVFRYYQDRHKKPDRSLSSIGYQVLMTAWSISWNNGPILLLTPFVKVKLFFQFENQYSKQNRLNTRMLSRKSKVYENISDLFEKMRFADN